MLSMSVRYQRPIDAIFATGVNEKEKKEKRLTKGFLSPSGARADRWAGGSTGASL